MFKICIHDYVPLVIMNSCDKYDFYTALTKQKCKKCGKIRECINSVIAIDNEWWNQVVNKKTTLIGD